MLDAVQNLQSKYWISNKGWGQTDEAAERLSAMMPAETSEGFSFLEVLE